MLTLQELKERIETPAQKIKIPTADDSVSERALRNFSVGRKNWAINTLRGAQASAVIYGITEIARANELKVYYYIKYLLEQLVVLIDEQGNIEQSKLEPYMPWSKSLPDDCYSKRRNQAALTFIRGALDLTRTL